MDIYTLKHFYQFGDIWLDILKSFGVTHKTTVIFRNY